MLRPLSQSSLFARTSVIDTETLSTVASIIADVRNRGESALRDHAVRLGDRLAGEPLVLSRIDMNAALDRIDRPTRELLERTAARITSFAQAQLACLTCLDMQVEGGRAGHTIAPMDRAGCYAPGGRFPLPSSVLMTACTARVAGVREVWVASPRPTDATLAAAAIANADGVLAVGGAQAIAALAYGAGDVPASDIIVGPGNRWVTAAKKLVFGDVAIDMLAGPSEVVVLADETADSQRVAADLLAQAEHDPDARAVLITTSQALINAVNQALEREISFLPADSASAATARAALANHSGSILCTSLDEAIAWCDRMAPEHLEVVTRDPRAVATRLNHYGALFLGSESAEVLGDYGMGPNHVLPTGSTARFSAGLSVFTFLRVRTWLEADRATIAPLARDAQALAMTEGLLAHARAARLRI